MGEQFITQHTEAFVHQRDAQKQLTLATRTLFSDRQELFEHVYRCRALDVAVPLAPELELLVTCADGGRLVLSQGNRLLGYLDGAEAADLTGAFASDPRASGMARAQVFEAIDFAGDFRFRLIREGGGASV